VTRRLLVESTILGEPVLHGLHDPWHTVGSGGGEPSFVNGWVAVSGYPVQFRKDEIGNVHIRGTAQSGTYGAHVFTLPTAYRPSTAVATFTYLTNANPTTAIPIVIITTATGAVAPTQKIGTATAISLNVIYSTEP
jgi:hypothetical protein